MEKNFMPLGDHDLNKHMKDIISGGSDLKGEIFRSIVLQEKLNVRNIKLYESMVNNFLKFWDDYSNNLSSAIKDIDKIPEGAQFKTIDYGFVKNFIYADYDYASVLQFVDGVITGIKEDEMKKPEDVEEFRDYTIEKAFSTDTPTVGSLIDSVLSKDSRDANSTNVTALDTKMFMNIRNYDKLFPSTKRTELYKAISKVIEYITGEGDIETIIPGNIKDRGYDGIKLFISLINNMVEYITYSLAAYACRVYIISAYCRPFIETARGDREAGPMSEGKFTDELRKIKAEKDQAFQKLINSGEETAKAAFDAADEIKNKAKDKNKSLDESVKLGGFDPIDISENPGGSVSSVFQNLTEVVVKDPKRQKEFFEKFRDFVKLVGADTLFEREMPEVDRGYFSQKDKQGKLFDAIGNNPLYEMIRNPGISGGHYLKDADVSEFHNNYKMFMYNKYQGMSGFSVPRNDLLHAIARTSYGESVNDYKKLAKDLYVMASEIGGALNRLMENTTSTFDHLYVTNRLGVGSKKLMSECTKFTIDLYQEVMFAFAQRAGFVERKINELRASEFNKTGSIFQLNVIPGMKSDLDETNFSMLSVPTTMRMPMEQMDVYQLPMFEALEMFDEYLRTVPEFSNDWYLNEALGDIRYSTLVNQIISFFQSMSRRIMDFFFRNLDKQKQWVRNKESELRSMEFDDNAQINNYIQYNVDLTSAGDIGKMIDGVTERMRGLQDEDFQSPDLFNKILDTKQALPDIDAATLDKMENKQLAELIKTRIMFKDNKPQQAVTLSLKQASKQTVGTGKTVIDGWVDTILHADNMGNQLNKWNNGLLNAFNSIKPKLIKAPQQNNPQQSGEQKQQPAQTQQSQQDSNSPPPDPQSPNPQQGEGESVEKENKDQQQPAPQASGGPQGGSTQPAGNAVVQLKSIIDTVWTPVYTGVVTALKHDYKCLQQAYGVRQK